MSESNKLPEQPVVLDLCEAAGRAGWDGKVP